MEEEAEDLRMNKTIGEKRDSKTWKGESQESEQPHHERMKMGWSEMCAARKTLSQCRCDIKNVCCERRENVTCAVHNTRRLLQIAFSCERSKCNKPKNLECRHVWGCVKQRHNGSQLRTSLIIVMSSTQESFHCHQDVLDEEDDGYHFWYCQ